ncbi:hypothetical protein [Pseudoalteromonas sp. MMG005]|uniref:hypothetical protein n=1 Tax=Pseudoalteromonas sp. MMG005 TaxID=2822682 RepID=UPI001B3A1495|nr:hypothetical protein [Pseudoalteromonas sp. MMG005]MBQ4847688.1 hypothetical protein [Pseudoalteromonas sp. MMG005]
MCINSESCRFFCAPTEQYALLVLQLSHSDYRIENGLAEFKYVEIKPSKNCAQL